MKLALLICIIIANLLSILGHYTIIRLVYILYTESTKWALVLADAFAHFLTFLLSIAVLLTTMESLTWLYCAVLATFGIIITCIAAWATWKLSDSTDAKREIERFEFETASTFSDKITPEVSSKHSR